MRSLQCSRQFTGVPRSSLGSGLEPRALLSKAPIRGAARCSGGLCGLATRTTTCVVGNSFSRNKRCTRICELNFEFGDACLGTVCIIGDPRKLLAHGAAECLHLGLQLSVKV
jgi:hypothetical protein